MIEPTITAEDLTLYALELLEGEEQTRVEVLLRSSTEARKELSNIRGDLALFALAAEQQTPPALTRQRLMKQVARERRTVPIEVVLPERGVVPAAAPQTFLPDAPVPAAGLPSPAFSAAPPQPPAPTHEEQLRPLPRHLQAPGVVPPATTLPRGLREAETVSYAGDPGSFAAERQTLPPEPQIFARDTPATSSTAHSVTMFEQHFASEATTQPAAPVRSAEEPRVGELPHPAAAARAAEPQIFARGRRGEDAVDAVEDRFVPSAAAPRAEAPVLSAYRSEREEEAPRSSGWATFFGWSGWAVAAAVAVAAAFALREDFNLREQLSQQQVSLNVANVNAAKAEAILQTLQSSAAQRFVLARTDAAPAPSGRVAYLPERGTLVFQASNLETLQPYKTYELWLIPKGEGRQPVPAGTFKPDGRGYASVVMPQLPKGLVAGNFGVTIEDEGGSATPTLPILLVGQQS